MPHNWIKSSLDLHPGRKPAHSGARRPRRAGPVLSVAGPACGHAPSPPTGPGTGRAGGLLGARGPPGLGACLPDAQVAAGGHAYLLPMVYGATQVPRTRCRRRKTKRHKAFKAVQAAFAQPPLTQRLAPPGLAEWPAWATDRVKVFQRAASAVEGRNGLLSQRHHHQRGLPQRRDRVWTVVHNCECHAADGTTPAARFFRQPVPDLFATVL